MLQNIISYALRTLREERGGKKTFVKKKVNLSGFLGRMSRELYEGKQSSSSTAKWPIVKHGIWEVMNQDQMVSSSAVLWWEFITNLHKEEGVDEAFCTQTIRSLITSRPGSYWGFQPYSHLLGRKHSTMQATPELPILCWWLFPKVSARGVNYSNALLVLVLTNRDFITMNWLIEFRI